MKRILESELMEEDDQVRAYAEADFAEPHNNFIVMFTDIFPGQDVNGYALDLGCGPGDISIRFAKAYSNCTVHGIDGSEAMLCYGNQALGNLPEIADRVKLYHQILPAASLPHSKYDVVISNSLLHHLPDPQTLWNTVKLYAKKEALLFVMDLKRPGSVNEARNLTETYTSNEPEILQRDFYNSLLASFRIDEIEEQLKTAGLEQLSVKQTSDRHVLIYGKIC
ncbi:MAG: class I SAM-dependent methyltransferase [Candidatus Anammoxibacter sp.]